MATTVSRVQAQEPFDRAPFIFEKKRIDDFGNESTEVFYSAAGRKEEFRYLYPDGYWITEIIELRPNFAVVKCSVYLNKNDDKPYRNAFASRELDATTEIGRRFIECAETAAVGRALAAAGIGADALLDDFESEERKATGGSPIGKVSGGAGAKPKEPEKPLEEMPESMSDEEALKEIIKTTESKSLKGKTFGEAIGMVRDQAKFRDFLKGLVTVGNPREKMAAAIMLAKFTGDKAEAA